MSAAGRFPVLGSWVNIHDMGSALREIGRRLSAGDGGYVCFTNVHATVVGRQNAAFRAITNNSFLSLADGRPIYWVGRALRAHGVGHVPGPDFLIEAVRAFPHAGHFFYGSTPRVLARLCAAIEQEVPTARICGSMSPPFKALSEAEKREHYATIRRSGAAFVWIGLGAPKQELWMAEAAPHLQPSMLFGVGAAFDFHARTARRAPQWMKKAGLEWLHRLSQEPRRLWRRYLVTNSLFVYYLLRELRRMQTSH